MKTNTTLDLEGLLITMRASSGSWFDRTDLETTFGTSVIEQALDDGLIEDVHGHCVMLTELGENPQDDSAHVCADCGDKEGDCEGVHLIVHDNDRVVCSECDLEYTEQDRC